MSASKISFLQLLRLGVHYKEEKKSKFPQGLVLQEKILSVSNIWSEVISVEVSAPE